MKQGLTLATLAERVQEVQRTAEDYVVPTTKIEAVYNTILVPKVKDGKVEGEERVNNPVIVVPGMDLQARMTNLAAGQVAHRLGIPVGFYERLLKTQPALWQDTVNTLLHERADGRMLRFLRGDGGDVMRAYLSNKYLRIDNAWVLASILPIAHQHGLQVVSCHNTESRLYLKMTSSNLEFEVQKGDVVRWGIVVWNSEVGLGVYEMAAFCERLVCTNGMVATAFLDDTRLRRTHLGPRLEEGEAPLQNDTIESVQKALLLSARDKMMYLLDNARRSEAQKAMQRTVGVPITGDVAEVVQRLGKAHNLHEAETARVLNHLAHGGNMTQWGLANAVTRAAQDSDSYDRATDLETIGGRVVAIEAREWARLNAVDKN